MKRGIYFIVVTLITWGCAVNMSLAQTTGNLDQLLKQVQQGKIRESAENAAREKEFRNNKAARENMLADAKKERARLEDTSAKMESQFDQNELDIADQTDLFKKRLGSLTELFGVLQQAAGDARGNFESSLTDIEFPDRSEFLTKLAEKMGSSTQLASLDEIEHLWFLLQQQMTEEGKIVKFRTRVVEPGGDEVDKEVIRAGVFNLISEGKYLKYEPETKKVSVLLRQPKPRYLETAEDLTRASSGLVGVGLDPTKGQLLGMLIEEPSWVERATDQGGPIGWIIIILGGFALLIAILKILSLAVVSAKVAAQKRNLNQPSEGNPLGRVIKIYRDNKDIDMESLELKMGEAVLKELPGINRFNALLKVIAVVAPLLGLLGTVTGMIITFQDITLFGTGDPKMMAGGISIALVTTFLGLTVAIPTVFLHALVSGRSRRIVELLEEQATGMVAEASQRSA